MQERIQVLVVEDNRTQRQLLDVVLSGEGYEVHLATDGERGAEMARELRPALVVTDVNMPDCDGFDLLRRLRGDPETAGIPILFVTARSSEEDYLTGFSLGADDYLTKPYLPSELVQRVHNVLARTGHEPLPHEAAAASGQPPALLSGRLSTASVIEVLQTLGPGAASGQLEVRNGQRGCVELRDGCLVRAEVRAGGRRLVGLKAWLRLARWTEGTFELRDRDAAASGPPQPELEAEALQTLLAEAAFQRDEFFRLRAMFPPEGLVLLRRGIVRHDAPALDQKIWERVIQPVEIDALLDELDEPDADILRSVVRLVQNRIVGGKQRAPG
jgi:CheY-like chemotaxis protein